MEHFFLDLGLSYTLSKLLPFILMTILGLIIGICIIRKTRHKIGKIAGFLSIFIPFTAYFAVNPIYQGDFTNEARMVEMNANWNELKDKKFVVVAMAGCPYCFQSIATLKEFKKRNPKVNIEFLVTSSDVADLEAYEKEIDGAFKISLAQQPEEISRLVEGRFPTFLLIENQDISIWNNNNFGVKALDKIVANFN